MVIWMECKRNASKVNDEMKTFTSIFGLVLGRFVRLPETRAQAEIGQLDVAIFINQDVIRFDVAMNELHIVDTFHCAHQFRGVESATEGKNRKFMYQNGLKSDPQMALFSCDQDLPHPSLHET